MNKSGANVQENYRKTTEVVRPYEENERGAHLTSKAMFTLSPVPCASGRLCVTTDPTRTVRRVHTETALRPVVTQLHVPNSWHISRFPGHELVDVP